MRFEISAGVLTNIIFDEEECSHSEGIDVIVPDGVIKIAKRLCPSNKTINIKSIVFPEGLKTIEEKAFWGQENLARITFPKTIDYIGELAFANIGKADIYFQEGTRKIEIERAAFSYSLIKSFIVDGNTDILILHPEAFEYATKLKNVKINSNLLDLGERCFGFCDSLESVDLTNTNILKHKIPERCFYRCALLSEIIFPGDKNDRIKSIECCSFKGTGIKNLYIDYPIEICSHAFSECKELSTIQIIRKTNVPSLLMDNVFKDCPRLVDADLSGVVYIGESCFSGDINLKNVKLSNRPEDDVLIKSGAFFNTKITSIDCSSVVELGQEAFSNCKYLTDIKFAEFAKFKTIPAHAFLGNTSLKEIAIPQNITKISYGAFKDSGLKSIIFPSSLKNISPYAFCGCKNMSSINFSSAYNLEKIELGAFEGTNIKLFDFSVCIYLTKKNCSTPKCTKAIYSYYSDSFKATS